MKKTIFDEELNQVNFLDERFYEAGKDSEGNTFYYPSVTHILDIYPKGPGFTQWLKDVGNQARVIADRAAEAGNKVHNGIEEILKGNSIAWDGVNYDLNEWQGLCRFMDFMKQTQAEVLAFEVNVFSHTWLYAGTVDLICKIGKEADEQIWLIDHKFGNAIYPSHFQQVIAYRGAAMEMNKDLVIDRVGILHLKAATRTYKAEPWQGPGWQLVDPMNDRKTKEVAKANELDPYESVWQNFTRTLGIYYYENPDPKPKFESYPAELGLGMLKEEG